MIIHTFLFLLIMILYYRMGDIMLLSIDAKIDKNGLLYIDNDSFKRYPLNLNYNLKICNLFYSLLSTDDYIIKYSLCSLKQDQLIQMLVNLKKLQKSTCFLFFLMYNASI